MGSSRFVRPDTCVLKISNGDTLTVKRRLNAGEQRAKFARMYSPAADGALAVNHLQAGLATVTAYLVDWTLSDETGLVEIRGKSIDEVTSALDALSPGDFAEVRKAIEAHEDAMQAERTAEKNGQDGGTASPAISPSPSAAAGGSSGSASSTPTITVS